MSDADLAPIYTVILFILGMVVLNVLFDKNKRR